MFFCLSTSRFVVHVFLDGLLAHHLDIRVLRVRDELAVLADDVPVDQFRLRCTSVAVFLLRHLYIYIYVYAYSRARYK